MTVGGGIKDLMRCTTKLFNTLTDFRKVKHFYKELEMAKKVTGYINLIVPAGSATPAPPLGPALGQKGVNIKAFVDDFNGKTADMQKGMPIPVVITVFEDKSYEFIMKKPPNTYFIKQAIKLKSGSKTPGHEVAGQIRSSQVKKSLKKKWLI